MFLALIITILAGSFAECRVTTFSGITAIAAFQVPCTYSDYVTFEIVENKIQHFSFDHSVISPIDVVHREVLVEMCMSTFETCDEI